MTGVVYAIEASGIAAGRPYAYTVGLTEAGLPELLVVGLTPCDATVVLDLAARRHAATAFNPDSPLELGLYTPVTVTAVDPQTRTYLTTAVACYGDRLDALQIVWAATVDHPDQAPDWDLHRDAQKLR